MEMSRAGRRFYAGCSAAITGIAPVQAIPTTAAQWVLWNADTNRTYFFDMILMALLSGTPGLSGDAWMTLFSAPAQTGLASGITIQSASGGGLTSKASIKSGVTITAPAAPTWFPLGSSIESITAAAFSAGYSEIMGDNDVKGAIAVPP